MFGRDLTQVRRGFGRYYEVVVIVMMIATKVRMMGSRESRVEVMMARKGQEV